MPKLRTRTAVTVLLILLASAACTSGTTAPGPNTLSGTFASAGYLFHRWEAGLSIIVIHDVPGSFFCEGTSSTSSPEYVLECSTQSDTGGDVSWTIRTVNGKQAAVQFDNEELDLDRDALILVRSDNGRRVIEKHYRNLSNVPFEHTAILELAELEIVIQDFVTSLD